MLKNIYLRETIITTTICIDNVNGGGNLNGDEYNKLYDAIFREIYYTP